MGYVRSCAVRSITGLGCLALGLRFGGSTAEALEGDVQCGAGAGKDGSCTSAANASPGHDQAAAEFLEGLRERGLQIRLQASTVQEKVVGSRRKHRNRTAVVVAEDVFYGRPIAKLPRDALLSIETAQPKSLRKELQDFLFDSATIRTEFNITSEDQIHLLSLAYPLIALNRDNSTVVRSWLDAVADERLTVLELSKRQRRVLRGTTVQGAYAEMARSRDLIKDTAWNLTHFRKRPVGKAEATWALAVIMRHARVVHPHQDVRGKRNPRMYLFPFRELLGVQLHPDPAMSATFQEEIVLHNGKREEEMVVQIAKKDMPKGEEVFHWPGRLSNSEMTVRHGFAFDVFNPVGIGRNITQPPNWETNPNGKMRREYAKYDCTTLEAFELRFTKLGSPSKSFVRCFRVSWFLTNGWYTPGFEKRRRELETWPPPKTYRKEDWLSWTQADQELARTILEYCRDMRERLKHSIDSSIAADFRRSTDPLDRLLWRLRGEESKTFKECMISAQRQAH